MYISTPLPREPFLPHSRLLFQHLARHAAQTTSTNEPTQILEIGCGPQSPFLTWLDDVWPARNLHQIDAQASVVQQARRHNSQGSVEQLAASNLATIADMSQDIILGMSVFDQNADSEMPRIAAELRRVLKPGGLLIYVHNEELNLPATAASLVYESFNPLRLKQQPQVLLPNDRWEPRSELEHCLADFSEIQQALQRSGESVAPLARYLQALHPSPSQLTPASADGRQNADYMSQLTPSLLHNLRSLVAQLRNENDVQLQDVTTSELFRRRVIEPLLLRTDGFDVIAADLFELRTKRTWSEFLQEKPSHACFVRGITKFGMATNPPIAPFEYCQQDLNEPRLSPEQDEVVLIAQQFGCVARRSRGTP